LEGQKQKDVYFVSQGALARIIYDSNYKMHILSIALPEMALMSTAHLFSPTPSVGNIIALHANTRIIRIPYKALKHVQQDIPEVNTLISILNNKKKKQLAQLRIVSSISSTIDRYLYFAENMKNLKIYLTHKEAAQLLGISINSIYRALIKWRNR
jgi:CRP-like cAMP-binding protein